MAPNRSQMCCMGATSVIWEPYGAIWKPCAPYEPWEVSGVKWKLCVPHVCVISEAYVILCKPDAPDWSCVMQMGAMWCFMGAKFYVGAMLPHMGVL
jgi:hypothetical protein